MNPTIQDVANKANVSIATVSRVLNDLPGYSEKTKQKVLQAIEDLGYQPNAIARGLVNRKTGTIGVLFPSVSGLLSAEVLHGIEAQASEEGHSVIVCNTEADEDKTLKYIQLLSEKRVDGLVFVSEEVTDVYYKALSRMGVPVVLVSTQSFQYPLPYVKVDDRHAAYTATRHLIQAGHTQLGMISGNEKDLIAGIPRMEGFKQAIMEAGLPFQESQIEKQLSFTYEAGQEGFKTLLTRHPEMTAVFAASDEIAIGAFSAAYEMGISIPGDVSVVGYDNLKLAEMSVPPLTTIAQPFQRMGEKAVEMVLQMNRGKGAESCILPHVLIERKSVSSRN
ncbi:LacI family transcriptional regulator [Pontibacillus halophilus JSM 076056 = DSM 19796]|uniref:LacI family transcriptional regulator n=1 Tax=Pontibacillus halophilus JSM 076056 = DSM 19796 TaxID=1385510 RepID=A0A0A5I5G7_9BACI|nr:LacI family DNA-binding transcriptional regulator [Pontibacillus halophilus]KGX91062.1 LacI family transcriptional regulator [Pontibacillus halophilus JSM 076056 = DSM 19796]